MATVRSPETFKRGDVVVRARAGRAGGEVAVLQPGTLATVCRVVTPGRTYKVRYATLPVCVVAFHQSLRLAPAGSIGPACPDTC